MTRFDRHTKNNNKGFSLVELIVIVLIVGILSSTAVVGISTMHNANVTSARDRLVGLLTNTRGTTIAKSDNTIWFEISFDGSDYKGTLYEGTKYDYSSAAILAEENLGNDRLSITAKKSDGSVVQVSSSSKVVFDFVKATGGIDEDYTDVEVTNGDKIANIIVIKETGRCFRDV